MRRFRSKLGVVIIFLLTITLLDITVPGKCVPDTTIQDVECKPETWADNDYGTLVQNMLPDLLVNCPAQPRYQHYIYYTDDTYYVYGYAKCNEQLLPTDCSNCLNAAQQTISSMCPYAIGAKVVLTDCRVRYDNTPFYGP